MKPKIVTDSLDTECFIKKTSSYTYLDGYWQSEKYFNKYKEGILKVFAFKENTIQVIPVHENSVSIHIRRGDYVTNKAAEKVLGVLPQEYYYEAIDYILKRIEKPVFYVFSDDIEWVKNNFKFKNINFIFPKNKTAHNDMFQISLCKHNIIANSSFSWWGAWLNNNPEKIVIAPQRWYANEQKNEKLNRIPQNWIQI